jgi:hypothetical protein
VHKKVDFVDMDGDGLLDRFEVIADQWHYSHNDVGTFADPVPTGVIDHGYDPHEAPSNDVCHGAPVGGLNGDGRGEFIVQSVPPCNVQIRIFTNDSGGPQNEIVHLPELLPPDTVGARSLRWQGTVCRYNKQSRQAGSATPCGTRYPDSEADGRIVEV